MRLLALVLALSLQASEKSPVTVLRGAKVYTAAGAPLDHAIVVIENGKIAAVGKEVPVPPDARIIEAAGKTIIPGLIDPASRLFLPPGERSAGSAEQTVLDALDLYQPDYREAVEQGVTTAYVGPVSGLG